MHNELITQTQHETAYKNMQGIEIIFIIFILYIAYDIEPLQLLMLWNMLFLYRMFCFYTYNAFQGISSYVSLYVHLINALDIGWSNTRYTLNGIVSALPVLEISLDVMDEYSIW